MVCSERPPYTSGACSAKDLAGAEGRQQEGFSGRELTMTTASGGSVLLGVVGFSLLGEISGPLDPDLILPEPHPSLTRLPRERDAGATGRPSGPDQSRVCLSRFNAAMVDFGNGSCIARSRSLCV